MKYLAENVKNPDNKKTNSIYEWSRGSLKKGKDLIVCTLNLNFQTNTIIKILLIFMNPENNNQISISIEKKNTHKI